MSPRPLLRALALVLLPALPASAQLSKTFHLSCSADSARVISLDLQGDVTAVPWNGNLVLVETTVRLTNANEAIFRYVTERTERYTVACELGPGDNLLVRSVDPDRKPIRTQVGVSGEEVTVRVLVPRRFQGEDLGPFGRVAASMAVPPIRADEGGEVRLHRPELFEDALGAPARTDDSTLLQNPDLTPRDSLSSPDTLGSGEADEGADRDGEGG